MNLNPHHYMIYFCVRYVIFAVKNVKPPFFKISLDSEGYYPPPPELLVKCECFYFCAKVRNWINLREKYATKFGLLIYYKKNVDF